MKVYLKEELDAYDRRMALKNIYRAQEILGNKHIHILVKDGFVIASKEVYTHDETIELLGAILESIIDV